MRGAWIAELAVVVSLAAGIGASLAADTPLELKDVSIERTSGGASVRLRTSGPAQYVAQLIDSPTRLVIDLIGATYNLSAPRLASNVEPVKEVRCSQWRKGITRIVVEMARTNIAYRIEETPDGLLVAVEKSGGRGSETKLATTNLSNWTRYPVKIDSIRPVVAPVKLPREVAFGPTSVGASAHGPAAVAEPIVGATATPADGPAPAGPLPRTIRTPARAAPTLMAPHEMVAQAATPSTPGPFPPPAAAPASGERLISFDFKDADVVNLLRILATESGRNIVAGDDVKGRVSISLKSVTWDRALDTILKVRGLARIEEEDVIRIVSIEQLTKEREAVARVEAAKRNAEIETRTKLAEAQLKETELATKKLAADAAAAEARARGPLREEVIRLSYADPEDVARTLQGILGIPPEGTQAVPSTIIPSIPAVPTVVPSGGGPPNPALGRLSAPQTPYPPAYGPSAQPVISVSQDVLAKGITVRANRATNSVFIRHYEADLERIKKLIREQLDVPLPQVKIEARMEILDRNSLEAIGIQWGGAMAGTSGSNTLIGQGFTSSSDTSRTGTGVSNLTSSNPNLSLSSLLPIDSATGLSTGGNLVNLPFSALPNASTQTPSAGFSFGIVGTRFNINLALQALATLGKTRTIAQPEIVTLENSKATFTLGEEIPYATVSSAGTQVQFKEAVLRLEVTPTVVRERIDGQEVRQVKMTVIVENNSRGDVISPSSGVTVPIINRRKVETQVLVKEGERLVISGVTQNVQQKTVRKVPLMGDVPILGWLFKQREDYETGRELVVFMTPSILRSVRAATP